MKFINRIILPYKYTLVYTETSQIVNGKEYGLIILKPSLTYIKYTL